MDKELLLDFFEFMRWSPENIPGYVKTSYIGKNFCGQGYFFDESEEV